MFNVNVLIMGNTVGNTGNNIKEEKDLSDKSFSLQEEKIKKIYLEVGGADGILSLYKMMQASEGENLYTECESVEDILKDISSDNSDKKYFKFKNSCCYIKKETDGNFNMHLESFGARDFTADKSFMKSLLDALEENENFKLSKIKVTSAATPVVLTELNNKITDIKQSNEQQSTHRIEPNIILNNPVLSVSRFSEFILNLFRKRKIVTDSSHKSADKIKATITKLAARNIKITTKRNKHAGNWISKFLDNLFHQSDYDKTYQLTTENYVTQKTHSESDNSNNISFENSSFNFLSPSNLPNNEISISSIRSINTNMLQIRL